MKRIFIFLFTLMAVLAMMADPVGRDQAAKLATRYMKNGVKPTLVNNGSRKAAAGQNAPLYIFSRGAGEGFVIVSGDDSMPSILAVTDSGDYDEATLPPALVDMVAGWREIIIANQTAGAPKMTPARIPQGQSSIEPMVKTHWSQNAPYNLKCPVGANSTAHAMTGCVPTAISQVVYYWSQQEPSLIPSAVRHTTEKYNNASAPITDDYVISAGTPYNWNLMEWSYNASSSEESKQAVATLMATIGLGSKVVYRTSSTSGALTSTIPVLRDQFDLRAASFSHSAYPNEDDWAAKLLTELNAGRPVAYGGVGSLGGHAFICDGYDAGNGTFHFNFGWGGTSDAYCAVTNAAGSCGGFWNSQQILTICPESQAAAAEFAVTFTTTPFVYNQPSDITVQVTNNSSQNISSLYVLLSPYEPDLISNYTTALEEEKFDCTLGSGTNTATFTFTPGYHTTYNVKIIDDQDRLLYTGSVPMTGDAAGAPDMPTFRPYILTNLDDITNGHIYTLVAKSVAQPRSPRGYMANNSGTLQGADYVAGASSQQFAIVKGSSGYYLWNVQAQKFVPANGTYSAGTMTLSASPNGIVEFENASVNGQPNNWRIKRKDQAQYIQANTSKGIYLAALNNSALYDAEWFIEAVGELPAATLTTVQNTISDYESSDWVNVTIDLKRALGTFYSDAEGTNAVATADGNDSWKAWRLTDSSAPEGLDLIVRTTDGLGSVNTKISNYYYANSSEKSICFTPGRSEYAYSIGVSDDYYIIGYEIGTRDYNGVSVTCLTSGTYCTASANSNTNQITLTSDSIVTHEVPFGLFLKTNGGTPSVAATKLQVRVVNKSWLGAHLGTLPLTAKYRSTFTADDLVAMETAVEGRDVDAYFNAIRSLQYRLKFVNEVGTPLSGLKLTGTGGVIDSQSNTVTKNTTAVSAYWLNSPTDATAPTILSYTVGNRTFNSWAELTANVAPDADVVVKVRSLTGKYYTLKNVSKNTYAKVDNSNGLIVSGTSATDMSYIFRIDDACAGTYYLYCLGNGQYAKRPGTYALYAKVGTTETLSYDNAYRIACLDEGTKKYGFGDAFQFVYPLAVSSAADADQYYLHADGNDKIVRWACAPDPSRWIIEEVHFPVVTVVFKNRGTVLPVTFTATNVDAALCAQGKIMSCATGITLTGEYAGYGVTEWKLGETVYGSAEDFFAALNALTEDATATFSVSAGNVVTHKYLLGGTPMQLEDETTESVLLSDTYTLEAHPIAGYAETTDYVPAANNKLTDNITITHSYKRDPMPFEASTLDAGGHFGSGMKWYYIRSGNNGDNYWRYEESNAAKVTQATTATSSLEMLKQRLFAFEAKDDHTYYIYNYAAGEGVVGAVNSAARSGRMNFKAKDDATFNINSITVAKHSTGKNVFFLGGTESYFDRSGGGLVVWNGDFTNTNDGKFQVCELPAPSSDDLRSWASEYLNPTGAYGYTQTQLTALNAAITSRDVTAYVNAMANLDAIAAAGQCLVPTNGRWYTIRCMTSANSGVYMYDNNGTVGFHDTCNEITDLWQAEINDDGSYYLRAASGKYFAWPGSGNTLPALGTSGYKLNIDVTFSNTNPRYSGNLMIWGINANRILMMNDSQKKLNYATGQCTGYSHDFKFTEVPFYNITINTNPSFVSGTYSWNGAELTSGVAHAHLSANPVTDGTLNAVSCTAGYRFDRFTIGNETVTELNNLTGDVTLTAHYAPDVFTSPTASFGEYKWMLLNNANEPNYYVSAKNVGASPLTGVSVSYIDENQLWAFVGTADNFLIYNKALGDGYVLTSAAATPADGTYAKMQAYNAGAAATQQWKLEGSYTSVADKPGYGLLLRGSNAAFGLNKYGGEWRFWNYNDSSTGSRWLITPVERNFTVVASVTGTPAPTMEHVARLTFNVGGQNSTVVVDGAAEYAFYTPENIASITVTPTQVYRGYTLDNNAAVTVAANETATLNFTADETTKDRYIFYDYNEYVPGTGNVATRIPAIGKMPGGNLIAVADYRITGPDLGQNGAHNVHTDLLGRISTDNGHTWSEPIMVADGSGIASTNNCGYSDPALVVNSSNPAGELVVFSVTGHVGFTSSTRDNSTRIARTYSNDGGATWTITDITEAVYAAIPTAKSMFFSSGRVLESGFRAATASYNRIYVALDVRLTDNNNNRNFVIYSDDFGLTWQTLGSNSTPVINVNGDECKVVEMPNGNILLSSRTGSGRLMAEYDMATASWSSSTSVGHSAGLLGSANACNGEVLVVPARRASDNQPVKLLLQSVPTGNARKNVTIFYTEVDNNTTVANLAEANRWKTGIQVSNTTSAYSTMVRMNDYKVAFIFEEVEVSRGYDIVFMPLTISQITKKNYDTPFETVDIRVDTNNGTGLTDGWTAVWTSTSTDPQVTLKPSNGKNNMTKQTVAPNIRLAAGQSTNNLDYNIETASEGWKITNYSFNFTPYSSGTNTLTVTPSGGTAVSSSNTTTTKRVSQLGLDTQTATFQMGSTAYNQQILVSDFIVTLCKPAATPMQSLSAESEAIDLDIYGAGETTGYYPSEQRDRLVAAHATARDIVAAGWQTYDDEAVKPALDELRAALAAMTVNAPAPGRFYRIKGKDSGRYGTATAATDNYAAMVADTDADFNLGTIFYLTEDNTLLNFKRGVCITSGAQVGAVGDEGSVCDFVAGRTPAPYFGVHAGGYWMYDYGNNATYHSIARMSYNEAANIKADNKYQFQLIEVNTLPLTIGQYKLATLNLPVACDLEAGVKAYRAKEENGDQTRIILEQVETDADGVTHLDGNDPVLLYAEPGEYEITVSGDLTQNTERNNFSGTVAAITKAASDNKMVLGVISENPGFYKTQATFVNGFKAYYNFVPKAGSGANVRGIMFSFGDIATAIEASCSEIPEGTTYNLNGQKVTNVGNGVFIVNGKKIFVR